MATPEFAYEQNVLEPVLAEVKAQAEIEDEVELDNQDLDENIGSNELETVEDQSN